MRSSSSEAQRIRRHWETLKRVAENFVASSEAGLFEPIAPKSKG